MPASAAKTRVALQVVPPSPLSAIAAPMSPESFTSLFRQSFEFVQLEPSFDTSVDETDGSGYAFRYPDVPLDRLGRFQIHRVWHMTVDFRATTGFRDFKVNVYKSIGFEGRWLRKKDRVSRRDCMAEGGRGQANLTLANARYSLVPATQ